MVISCVKYWPGDEYFETTIQFAFEARFQFASGPVLQIEWWHVDKRRKRHYLQGYGYDFIAKGILCRFSTGETWGGTYPNVLSCGQYPDILAFLLGLDDVRTNKKDMRRIAGFDVPPGFLFPMFDYLVESGGELGAWIEERMMGGVASG